MAPGTWDIIEGQFHIFSGSGAPSLIKQFTITKDRNMPVPVTEKPEDLNIVVAGGTGNGNSTLVAGMRRKVIAEIDKHKPRKWQQLVDTAKKELFY